jgi:2-keto-4-pentenoate hydratase
MSKQETAQRDGEIAAAILRARLGGERLDPAAVAGAASDADSAYALQLLVTNQAPKTELGPVVGYKIGMSTTAAQRQHGIDEAIMGRVYASRLLESGARLTLNRDRRIGIECEIGVRLATDLRPEAEQLGIEQVAAAAASYHVAIEIVEDRFSRPGEAPLWAMAADDMFGMGGIIGPALAAFDPAAAHGGSLAIDGRVRAEGSSADLVGGGPLPGIAWLARRLAGQGRHLRAGDFILSGGLNAPLWLAPNGSDETAVVATIDGTSARFVVAWQG